MKVRLWGTRGSVGTSGPASARYGGNTSCVEVQADDGTRVILDAGTGIRALGATLGPETGRVDVMLSPLHIDLVQGLGFFRPLDQPGQEVHLWGPPALRQSLEERLHRYLAPPLFPVRLCEMPCELHLHEFPRHPFRIGGLTIQVAMVCHPGPTVGLRIEADGTSLAYLPDHEPCLGPGELPEEPDWTSGFDIARDVDLLIHDSQFGCHQYHRHVGWGHCTLDHALGFAAMTGARRLLTFHHDPRHDDDALDTLLAEACARQSPPVEVIPGREGLLLELAR